MSYSNIFINTMNNNILNNFQNEQRVCKDDFVVVSMNSIKKTNIN